MKLTVLIPVYNTPSQYLFEAVFSILNQSDKTQHTILLINDGSTNEDTLTGLRFLQENYNNITVVTLDNNYGTSVALNKGHELVKTEYVAIMGSDDISHRNRFFEQIHHLTAKEKVDVLGTNLFMFHNDDITRKSKHTTYHTEIPNLTRNWFINHGTVIYKQKAIEEMNGYNKDFKRGQDVELWTRMKLTGNYKFANVTDILYAWRRFDKNFGNNY